MSSRHGGARRGSGPRRIRRTITRDAARALRLIAKDRYGRPTTDTEEDAVLSALVMEAANLEPSPMMATLPFCLPRRSAEPVDDPFSAIGIEV